MRLGFGIIQEQTQKLIMTPELRQAITILQLSAVELTQFIEEQMLENPLLEITEETTEKYESSEDENTGVKEESIDPDWKEYFQDKSDSGFNSRELERREALKYENFVSQTATLQEHLLFQFNLTISDPIQRIIGEFIIGNIDDAGYLQETVEALAERFAINEGQIEEVLKLIQSLEPPGVGARNLKECLIIQIEHLGITNPIVREVITNYLGDLAEGRLQKIAQKVSATLKEVQDAIDIIKTLDPKPGRRFGSSQDVRYVSPDVVIERVEGEYIVLVNDVNTPRLNINSAYREILNRDHTSDPETRKFVEGKLNSASWLIKSIEQRRLTLYKVARTIADLQKDFLDHGIKELKPLNLKQVAELVGLHESTISRATANKYIQTPQGTIEFKFFFAHSVNSSSNSSSESVKRMLKEMVSLENTAKPLSDQKLAKMLEAKGIEISRRTVAKYREEMGIPATNKRKRY